MFLNENKVFGALEEVDVYLYYDGPRLLTASNGAGHLFLINCLDGDDEMDQWLVCAVSERRLNALEAKSLTLREAFTIPESGILVQLTTDFAGNLLDSIILVPSELHEDQLPKAGIFLPVQGAGNALLIPVRAASLARTLNANIVLLRMYPGRRTHEAPARAFGSVVSSLDGYLNDRLTAATRSFPTPTLKQPHFEVNVAGTYPGSFGVEFAVRSDAPEVWLALKTAVEDLNIAREPDTFRELMAGAEKKEAGSMKKLLTTLSAAKSDLAIEASNREGQLLSAAEVPLASIRNAVLELSREVETHPRNTTVEGRLMTLSLRTRRFELEAARSGLLYRGSTRHDIFNNINKAELPSTYRVALEADVSDDQAEDPSKIIWRMISATKLP